MTRDRSLDEFFGESDDAVEADETPVDGSGDGDDAGEDSSPEEVPDLPSELATYSWSPTAVDCDRCGQSVDRRWRDGEEMVCPECKEW